MWAIGRLRLFKHSDLSTHQKRTKHRAWYFWPEQCEEPLTESSCVCGLGEIFWHLPVDIESEERGGERETMKKEGEEE